MHSKLIPYLEDHKIHTAMGNEVGKMSKELFEFEAKVEVLKSSETEEWYDRQQGSIDKSRERLQVFRDMYDSLDGITHDALSLRRKITLWCDTLRDEVLDGNKFPDQLTPEQVKVMGKLLKEMAQVYKENKEIKEKTKHRI